MYFGLPMKWYSRANWPAKAMCMVMACLGCGPSDGERERLKALMLREIGLDEGLELGIPRNGTPETVPDRVQDAWVTQSMLPMDDWEIQYLGNEPAGFFHRRIEQAEGLEPGILRLTARSRTRLRGREKQAEQKFDFVAFERENGALIRFEGSVEVGSRVRRMDGAVRDGTLAFQTDLYGRGDAIRLEWNALDRGPFAIEQSLMRAPMREGEQRRLRYFDPLLGRPIDAQLTAYDYFDTPTFDGQKKRLLEIQITSNAQDDVASSQIWADPEGRIHKRYSPSLDLKSFRCSPESARVTVDQSELADLPLRSIPIFSPSATSEAKEGPQRYRVESIQTGYTLQIPSRTHQVIRPIKNRRLDVTVYSASGLSKPIEGIEPEPSPPSEALANSVVIDANHPEIQRMAEQLLLANNASAKDPPERRARCFAQGIASRVQAIPFDRRVSSGRATLAAGKGDCFDLAALLAALCRSNGISARIAIGLRCDPQTQPLAMNLHAWTEIHDGTRWIPLDASVPDSEVSADRIKWVDTLWNSNNPYESILQLARQLSTLEVAIDRGGP